MKDLTILSMGPSRTDCPFQTKELWGVYRCILEPDLQDKKFDKLFCVDGINQSINDHPPIEIKSITKSIEKAKELGIPMVGFRQYDWPTEYYPLKEIVRKLKCNNFGPTPSWMIAYALYLGYERIELYGIDQGPDLAYLLGKDKMAFWIGYAIGMGVDVHLGLGSLKWSYSGGLAEVPIAWASEEYEKLYVKTVEDNERLANV